MKENEVKAISDSALCLRLEEVYTVELAGIEKDMRCLLTDLDYAPDEVALPTMVPGIFGAADALRKQGAEVALQRCHKVELSSKLWRHMYPGVEPCRRTGNQWL